jgi:hypothetical protein
VKISDEAMAAARARYAEMWGDGDVDRAGEQMLTDVLEAAVPVIVAEVLRRAAERINERAAELRADFRSGSVGIEYINGMEDAVGVVERTGPYL